MAPGRDGQAGGATEKGESKINVAPGRDGQAGGATEKGESKNNVAPMDHGQAGGATEKGESKINVAPDKPPIRRGRLAKKGKEKVPHFFMISQAEVLLLIRKIEYTTT